MTNEQQLVALRRVLSEAGWDCVYGEEGFGGCVLARHAAGVVRAKPSVSEVLVFVEDLGGECLASAVVPAGQAVVGAWALGWNLLEWRDEAVG